jgi:hypothetical protein
LFQADCATDEDARVTFLDLAMHWMRLAEMIQSAKPDYDLPAVEWPSKHGRH